MIQWCLVNNYTWILKKTSSHVAWQLVQSAWAVKFGKFIFVGSVILCFLFSAASSAYFWFQNNNTETGTHERAQTANSACFSSDFSILFQFYICAAASPAAAVRQNRSAFRGNQTCILPGTRKEVIIVSCLDTRNSRGVGWKGLEWCQSRVQAMPG